MLYIFTVSDLVKPFLLKNAIRIHIFHVIKTYKKYSFGCFRENFLDKILLERK